MTSLHSFSLASVHTHMIKLEREKFNLLRKKRSDRRAQDEICRLNVQIVQYALIAKAFGRERK
jgi:hypothetical protein